MLNYIKSECYRFIHTKEIYIFTGVCSGLVVVMNLVLFVFNRFTPNFPYGTTRFSFNMLIGNVVNVMFLALVLSELVFFEEYKNGTLKNVIAYGISRSKIFAGKVIAAILLSVISMTAVVSVYVGSAYLLLEDSGVLPLQELLKALLGALPGTLAALVLGIALLFLFEKLSAVISIWFVIMVLLPTCMSLVGMKVEIMRRLSSWMPYTMLQGKVTMSSYVCIWDTSQGMMKCVIAGCVGIILFYLIGWKGFMKKQIN